MKTLVIHPEDESTDFLKKIYDGTDWTVINTHIGKRNLREAIKSHDRIIMMGHGCEKGLFNGEYNVIVDSNLVYLLREKYCVAIWCNADVFFLKYGLKGIYTGMIISEYMEANLYCVNCVYDDIEKSNIAFANSMAEFVKDKDLDKVKKTYSSDTNECIIFNNKNIYKT